MFEGFLLENFDGGVGFVFFRLTRNLVALASPQGVTGPVAAGLVLAARALHAQAEWLAAYLTLLFRDEAAAVLAAAAAAAAAAPGGAAGGGAAAPGVPGALPPGVDAPALLRRAGSNTTRVLERVQALAMSAYGPAHGPGVRVAGGSADSVAPVAASELLSTDAHNLLLNAAAEKYVANMPAVWHPWL